MKTSKRLMNRRPLLSAYRKHSLVLCLGFVLLLFSLIPSVLLRDNAYIIVHDQLDGEVTNYVLLAKHLNDKIIPEFMSGEDNKNSLTPASHGTLLFFIILPGYGFYSE